MFESLLNLIIYYSLKSACNPSIISRRSNRPRIDSLSEERNSFTLKTKIKNEKNYQYWTDLTNDTIWRIKIHCKNLVKKITRCVIWRKRGEERDRLVACLSRRCNSYRITRSTLDGKTWFLTKISLLSYNFIGFNYVLILFRVHCSYRRRKSNFFRGRFSHTSKYTTIFFISMSSALEKIICKSWNFCYFAIIGVFDKTYSLLWSAFKSASI